MKTRDRVRYGGSVIEYEIRRSPRRRKTIQVAVDGSGVSVSAPMAADDDYLRAFVRKRAAWIIRHAEAEKLRAAPKRFVSGETVPYLGRNMRMAVSDGEEVRSPQVRFDHWRLRIAVPAGLEGDERVDRVRAAVMAWYRGRAEARVPPVVERWWPEFGRGKRSAILIRNQRKRWASCAPDGTLRFNWRVVMVPPALLEYIVVHELAHLRVRNHSPDFWNLVTAAVPDAQARRRRLKETGPHLPF